MSSVCAGRDFLQTPGSPLRNERADKMAEFELILGEISGKRRIATEGGSTSYMQGQSQGLPPTTRVQPEDSRMEQALAQIKWLHDIKRVASPSCACGAGEETFPNHRVFECPRFEAIQAEFLGGRCKEGTRHGQAYYVGRAY